MRGIRKGREGERGEGERGREIEIYRSYILMFFVE